MKKFENFVSEDVWYEMLRQRNDMTHIYNGEAARKLVKKILAVYIPEFVSLKEHLQTRYGALLEQL